MKKVTTSVFTLALMGAMSAQAGTVNISLSDTVLQLSDTLTVEVTATEFEEQVVGFGFTASFDDSILQLDSATVNSTTWNFLREDSSSPTFSEVAGDTSVIGGNLLVGPVTGDFPLATLTFTAIGLGESAISIEDAFDLTWSWADLDGNIIAPDFTLASDSVQVVPIPAAAWLFATALGGMGLLSRRNTRSVTG